MTTGLKNHQKKCCHVSLIASAENHNRFRQVLVKAGVVEQQHNMSRINWESDKIVSSKGAIHFDEPYEYSSFNANAQGKDRGVGAYEHLNLDSNAEEKDRFGYQGPFVDFQHFKIVVNGINFDTIVGEIVRRDYYELCLARESYLHNPQMSVNHELASETILETTIVADYLRNCNVSTTTAEFEVWDRILKRVEARGMKVGFMRSRLNHLSVLVEEVRMKKILPCFYLFCEKDKERVETEIQSLNTKSEENKPKITYQKNEKREIEMRIKEDEMMLEAESKKPWMDDFKDFVDLVEAVRHMGCVDVATRAGPDISLALGKL
ncbi:hypothetical protein OROMI_016710 [Orobanche minor]